LVVVKDVRLPAKAARREGGKYFVILQARYCEFFAAIRRANKHRAGKNKDCGHSPI
jgi:hypothetical protein